GSATQSLGQIFDTLNFTTPNNEQTTIQLNMSFDGIFSSYLGTQYGLGYQADSYYSVRIFDITGMDQWLRDSEFLSSIYPYFTGADITFDAGLTPIFNQSIRMSLNEDSSYSDLTVYDATNSQLSVFFEKEAS